MTRPTGRTDDRLREEEEQKEKEEEKVPMSACDEEDQM
jgi:hypothetical protein